MNIGGVLLFIERLLAVYIIFPILKYLYDNNEKLYNYLFIIVCIFTIGVNLLNLIMNIFQAIYSNFKLIKLSINNFINELNIFNLEYYYLYYFMLGTYLYKYKNKLMKHIKKINVLSLCFIIIVILYAVCASLLRHETYLKNYAYNVK